MSQIWRKLKNKKFLTTFLLVLVLVGVSFILVSNVYAATASTAAPNPASPKIATPTEESTLIGRFISYIFSWIISFEGQIIILMSRVLLNLMSYNGFVNAYAVTTGWTIVRDIANMFFILVLLMISIGTILRIESYNFKRLLPKVLLMAVLVNFSRTICGLMIDFAQVVMMTFAVSFASVAGAGDLMATLHISQMINASASIGPNKGLSISGMIVTGLLAVVLLAIAAIVILVMMVVIVMRMIMLWLLLVLSPLPFILTAFPSGQKYAQQWWQEFSKYVIVGPIMAFFLWLSLAVSATGYTDAVGSNQAGLIEETKKDETTVNTGTESTSQIFSGIGDTKNFLSFVIGIGMLMGGLMITQQLGVAGGGFAGDMFGKIRQTGLATGKFGMKLPFKTAGWVNRKAGAGEIPGIGRYTKGWSLNPVDWYQGFSQTLERRRVKQETVRQAEAGAKFRSDMTKGKASRAFAIFRLFSGSTADATEAFGTPVKFLKGGYETIFHGKTTEQMDEITRQRESEAEEIKAKERLVETKSVDQYGKEHLADQTAEGMYERRKRNDDIDTVDSTGAIKRIGANEIDQMLKDNGIAPNTDEADKFMRAFYADQSKKLVEKGQYYDRTGTAGAVDVKTINNAGKEFFQNKIKAADKEAASVAAGELTSSQMDLRQKELEDINRQMLRVLKEISSRSDKKATNQEKKDLERLREEGIAKGGKIEQFNGLAGKTFGYFGQSATNEATQKLTQANIKGKAARTNAERLEAEKYAKEKERESTNLKAAMSVAMAKPADREAQKARLTAEIEAGKKKMDKDKIEDFVPPTPYYAMEAYRALEREEISKLPDEMEYDELAQMINQAKKEKDLLRFTALYKKAAKDGNDNEVLKQFGYTTDFQGSKKFGDEILVGEMGMNRQQMLQVMSDIGYINEDVGHFSTARLVGIKNGVYEWMSEIDQAVTVAHECSKKEARAFLQRTNRLGYGGEDPKNGGKFKISLEGQLILANQQEQILYRMSRGEFNPSALAKLAQDTETLNKMVRKGLLKKEVVDVIVDYASRQGVEASAASFAKAAKQLSEK